MTVQYRLFCDFDNDGDFNEVVEDITVFLDAVSWESGRSNGTLSAICDAGKLTAQLYSPDGYFSSFNLSSPLNISPNKIVPRRKVQLVMTIGVGDPVVMWTGYLASILPSSGPTSESGTAQLTAYGVISELVRKKISADMHTTIPTGTAVAEVLNLSGISYDFAKIDTGQSTITRWWTSYKANLLQTLRDLESTEAGLLRESKDAKPIFEDRAHRAGHSVAAIFGPDNLPYQDLKQKDALSSVFNIITATSHTFDVNGTEDQPIQLWSMSGAPRKIEVGQSIVVVARCPSETADSNVVCAWDWTNLYSSVRLTDDVASTLMVEGVDYEIPDPVENASSEEITITNLKDVPIYVHGLIAVGIALVESDSTPIESRDDSEDGSINTYGERAYQWSARFLQDPVEAQGYCDHLLALYKDPLPILDLTYIANTSDDHRLEAQARDISDKLHIEASDLGIDGDFFVEYMKHTLSRDRVHTVNYLLSVDVSHTWEASIHPYTPKVIPGETDAEVPGALENLSVVGSYGHFKASWDDPLTNIKTLTGFAQQVSENADFSDPICTWFIGKIYQQEDFNPNKSYYVRYAARNLSGDKTTNTDADLLALFPDGWGPWTNAPLNPVSSGNPIGAGIDTVVPGMLLNMDQGALGEDFFATWDYPTVGANSIKEIAIEWSPTIDPWVAEIPGYIEGPTKSVKSHYPGKTFFIRVAAINMIGQGAWTYFNGSGSTLDPDEAVAISTIVGVVDSGLPGAPTSPTLVANGATFIGTIGNPTTGAAGIDDVCVQWSEHSDMSDPHTSHGFNNVRRLTGVLPGVTAYIRYAYHNLALVASNSTVKAALLAAYPTENFDYGWGPFSSIVGPVTSGVDASALASADSASTAQTHRSYAETARDAAETHAGDALTAKTNAEGARDTAYTHRGYAETARTGAEGARDTAQGYRNTSEGYKNDAYTYQNYAYDHRVAAESAAGAAEGARNTAQGYRDTAGTHATDADTARGLAVIAKTDAGTHATDADTARGLAVIAKTAAETAQSAAETAQSAADTAKAAAETAKTDAETAKTDAVTAKGQAETAKTDAETAQGLAEVAQAAAEYAADQVLNYDLSAITAELSNHEDRIAYLET